MTPPITYLWRLVGEGLALCYRAAPGYEVRLTPQASLILSGESVADLNYAVIDHGPHTEERLREFGHLIQARSLSIYMFLIDAVSSVLTPLAQSLGLQHVGEMPLMTYAPTALPAQSGDYRCERIESEAALQEANRVAASAFDLPLDAVQRAWGPIILDGPGVDIFLARQNGGAVSSVQTTRMGSTVGIWAMGTTADHQRKGAGQALLNHVIAYHAGRGAKPFFLCATATGQPLYERVGFRTPATAAVWVAGHTTHLVVKSSMDEEVKEELTARGGRQWAGGPTRRCSRRRFASSKIGAFLRSGFGSTVFPIYDGGVAERQDVGPQICSSSM
jgi:GNAT superfamily N-acetyltransferase